MNSATAQLRPPPLATNGHGAAPAAESESLVASLRRLDGAIESAIAELESALDRQPATASFRGLYVSGADADRILAVQPGQNLWSVPLTTPNHSRYLLGGENSRLATLQERFKLDGFDTDALLIAASPDLDQRYERLYGLLQDDVSRRRPTLATIARLASVEPQPQWEGLARFAATSALLRSGLARIAADPAQPLATRGSQYLVADPQVLHFLAGCEALDADLSGFCDLLAPQPSGAQSPSTPSIFAATLRRHDDVRGQIESLFAAESACEFVAASAWERQHLAHALASELGRPVLRIWLDRLAPSAGEPELVRALLAARLHGAVALIEDFAERPPGAMGASLVGANQLLAGVARSGEVHAVVVSSATPDELSTLPRFAVRLPGRDERRARWQCRFTDAGLSAERSMLDAVAAAFEFAGDQIDAAAGLASAQAHASGHGAALLTERSVFAAGRRQLEMRLPSLLRAQEPQALWRELVLTDDALHQLQEICAHVRARAKVFGEWGFGRTSLRGRGVGVLFSGASGTGKTTAAEVLAAELGRTLLRLDLAQVVSKYIGESEKNLAQVFDIAERTAAVLLIDEADALFAKRTAVSDAHDRYANIEVSYLLQRIETFQGIVVLTTNLQANIDTAFLRRLQFIVEFAFPDAAQRERIWGISVPAQAPRDPDLDFKILAQRYAVAGGSIRNIALSAAMLAADRGEAIAMRHLAHAAYREYQKLGKALPDGDYFAQGAPR